MLCSKDEGEKPEDEDEDDDDDGRPRKERGEESSPAEPSRYTRYVITYLIKEQKSGVFGRFQILGKTLDLALISFWRSGAKPDVAPLLLLLLLPLPPTFYLFGQSSLEGRQRTGQAGWLSLSCNLPLLHLHT